MIVVLKNLPALLGALLAVFVAVQALRLDSLLDPARDLWRRLGSAGRVFMLCALLAAVAIGGNKGGGTGLQGLPRPSALVLAAVQPEPSLDVVSVRTNGVSFRAASSNAVEVAAWRRTGGTEAGVWIESPTNAPLFAIGTAPVFRAYASMSGAVSFESTRRPPIGVALPDLSQNFQLSTFNFQLASSMADATSASLPASRLSTFNIQPSTCLYPVLCPLRTPLGFVPEANQGGASCPGEPLRPRFWHDALPGGGRVLTWEDVLVDRLPGRRVSLQAELCPSGDIHGIWRPIYTSGAYTETNAPTGFFLHASSTPTSN